MKKEKKVIAGLIVWTFINLVIWSLADDYKPRLDELYPFGYHTGMFFSDYYKLMEWHWFCLSFNPSNYYNYQEFLLYVVGAWMVFFLYKYLKKA